MAEIPSLSTVAIQAIVCLPELVRNFDLYKFSREAYRVFLTTHVSGVTVVKKVLKHTR